jgi:uncharacterized protein YcbX
MSSVVSVLRYPLKSAQGQRLDAVDVDRAGLRADRTWACLDAGDGTVVSAKHPRRWGRMLQVGTSLVEDGDEDTLTVHLGGAALAAGTPEADAALSAHLGHEVRLTRIVPEGARLHRLLPGEAGMAPEWMSAAPDEEVITTIAGATPGGRFVDYGPVHLLTTGALSGLRQRLGRTDVPVTRFRPNLVLEAAHDPEPGQELRLGDVVLRVLVPTPRCAVPGIDHGDESTDRALLSTLARHYRAPVMKLGRAACFGSYAEVLRPGRVRVGQPVRFA